MTRLRRVESPVTTRAALLQALSESPGHGYELISRIRERTDGGVVLNNNALYPQLRLMETSGLVACREEKAVRNRSVYKITAKGRRELDKVRDVVFQLFGVELSANAIVMLLKDGDAMVLHAPGATAIVVPPRDALLDTESCLGCGAPRPPMTAEQLVSMSSWRRTCFCPTCTPILIAKARNRGA